MGRAMVARLGLGLLLLALLLPANSSQSTSTAPNPANTTTTPTGGALLSTASLFSDLVLPSTSLLLKDSGHETSILPHLLNPIQMASRHPV
ncbi:unnamed protein product [Nyctereutes procyonoides]|uniref:(raccoon dog) hypothetical protein n=1 Tax=Nyctereutes procyonoides TaxID=34880 RepID=A0A811YH12_NYCPR|nr:unnamed protein product [Nyctereutes procyonoides]